MKYERYEELIELITVIGPPDDKKRSYKYDPYYEDIHFQLAKCYASIIATPSKFSSLTSPSFDKRKFWTKCRNKLMKKLKRKYHKL